MRIGLAPQLDRTSGGVCQYSVTTLRAVARFAAAAPHHEFVVFAAPDAHPILRELPPTRFVTRPWPTPTAPGWTQRARRKLQRLWSGQPAPTPHGGPRAENDADALAPRFQPALHDWLAARGVDLMFYMVADPRCFETAIPYVVALHDLQHRLQPEFPEVSANGEGRRREYQHRNAARFANVIVTDSQVGREDVLNCYPEVDPPRVRALPYLAATPAHGRASAAERLRLTQKYGLPERFVFYPAQFWPHKNHLRIVEALARLRDAHACVVPAVFVGSHADEIRAQTWRALRQRIAELRLEAQVFDLGYVPDEDLAVLYGAAAALVMPTFFGPTNIPVLEAWGADCPVLTSDLRGIREQVGDAGVLVDPRSVPALADGLARLWRDATAAAQVVAAGRERLARYTADDHAALLADILTQALASAAEDGPRRTALHPQELAHAN